MHELRLLFDLCTKANQAILLQNRDRILIEFFDSLVGQLSVK
jgi:hypothetical protein